MSSAQRNSKTAHARRRIILIISIAAISAVGAIALITFGVHWLGRTTVNDVEAMIDENLPPGSSADEILAFLEANDIDHGVVRPAADYSVLSESSVSADTMIIGAIIRDTSQVLVFKGDIQVFFVLNKERELERYIIREVFTGP